MSQRSFSKRLSVSAFIAYRKQHTEIPHLSWHGVCVRHGEDGMRFATGILHHSPQSGGQTSEVYMALRDRATALCRGAALGWCTQLCTSYPFPCICDSLHESINTRDFNTKYFGNTVISKQKLGKTPLPLPVGKYQSHHISFLLCKDLTVWGNC